MYNPKISWKASLAPDVDHYAVTWSLGGVAVIGGTAARNVSYDSIGYSRLFLTDNPAVVLKDGDVIGATVTAIDTSGLTSLAVTPTPATVSVPNSPPDAPTSVTLSLS